MASFFDFHDKTIDRYEKNIYKLIDVSDHYVCRYVVLSGDYYSNSLGMCNRRFHMGRIFRQLWYLHT